MGAGAVTEAEAGSDESFGPDGYLYIALGDGGGSGNNGQLMRDAGQGPREEVNYELTG